MGEGLGNLSYNKINMVFMYYAIPFCGHKKWRIKR